MKIGAFLGRTMEVVGVFLLIILFAIIIITHNTTVGHSVKDATTKNLEAYPIFSQDHPSFVSFLNRIVGNPDYARQYTYVNYKELQDEFSKLNISTEGDDENAESIIVLDYHRTIAGDPEDQYSISIQNFKNQMYVLKERGYETITLDEFYQFMRGEKQLPKKSFLLTFDDGIKETYYNVDPILQVLNYSAVMFVITGNSLDKESKYYLNNKELTQMQNSGRWDLESHSHAGHGRIVIDAAGNRAPFYGNKLWIASEKRLETDEEYRARTSSDLHTSKIMLEQKFNKTITALALPFSDFGQWESNYDQAIFLLNEEAKQQYKMVFYQFKPAINKDFRANYNNKKEDFYLVMRIAADHINSAKELMENMEAATARDLPYTEDYSNKVRWINLWGEINLTNASIVLSDNLSNSDTTGAMGYLDGSYLWQNYIYTTNVKEVGAQKIILLARFQDSEDYVSCKFSNGRVSIINTKDSFKTIVSEVKLTNVSLLSNSEIGISVQGNLVTCYLNGKPVTSAQVSNMPSNGGVGLRIEEIYADKAPTSFEKISIQPM